MNTPPVSTEDSLTLCVPGDLISTNAEATRNEAVNVLETAESAQPGWNLFQLDLTAARMVDSVGLNLIVYILRRVKTRGARMQITYTSPNILRIFTFTRLDQQVELVRA
jgi:anti-anti-sigma factor